MFGGVVGALFDVSQMNRVLQYANIFYHKRFIIENRSVLQYLSVWRLSLWAVRLRFAPQKDGRPHSLVTESLGGVWCKSV